MNTIIQRDSFLACAVTAILESGIVICCTSANAIQQPELFLVDDQVRRKGIDIFKCHRRRLLYGDQRLYELTPACNKSNRESHT